MIEHITLSNGDRIKVELTETTDPDGTFVFDLKVVDPLTAEQVEMLIRQWELTARDSGLRSTRGVTPDGEGGTLTIDVTPSTEH